MEQKPLDLGALTSALATGQDLDKVAGNPSEPADTYSGEATEHEQTTEPTDTLSQWEQAAADDVEEQSETDTEVSESSDEKEEQAEAKTDEDENIEYVKADGKKIKVDYSDRERIKRAHKLAAGMRKFQRERDEALSREKAVSAKLSDYELMVNKIKEAADKDDHNELVRIMTGGKSDLDTLVEARMDKLKLREGASEEELAQMDMAEKVAAMETKLARQEAEFNERVKKAELDREEATTKSIQAKIDPVYNKYRFAGKLGDPDAEAELDDMLWNTVLTKLEDHEQLTDEVISKEIKTVATRINKFINKGATKKSGEVSKERKRRAKETAQIQQVRGYEDSDLKKQAAETIKSGDVGSLFKNWDKFGKLFNG